MLRILAYHRVAYDADVSGLDPSLISAAPSTFECQMCLLKEQFRVIALGQLLYSVRRRTPLPARAVLLTFDDAYRDFARYAWPVLKRLRLPVTLFVPTGYPDHPEKAFWWDRLYEAVGRTDRREIECPGLGALDLADPERRREALRRLRDYLRTLPQYDLEAACARILERLRWPGPDRGDVLSWPELRRLAAEGVTLGSHTRDHAILPLLPRELARVEIAGSQEDLKREIGGVYPIFSYPGGEFDESVLDLARREGIVLAFAKRKGTALEREEHLSLRRLEVTRRITPALFPLCLKPPRERREGKNQPAEDSEPPVKPRIRLALSKNASRQRVRSPGEGQSCSFAPNRGSKEVL